MRLKRFGCTEVNELELKRFVLDELLKLELKGVKVVDFSIDSSSTKFVIAVEHSTVSFVVNDENQFQILSVVYNEKEYVNADYLSQFNDFIAAVVSILKPVVKEKVDEYAKRSDMIEYREARAKLKEEQLEKRALTIQAREQLLEFHVQAIDIENQILEDEKTNIDPEPNWLVIGGVAGLVLLVVLILILIL